MVLEGGPATAIVAGDQADGRSLFGELLQRAGLRIVAEAESGDSALNMIRQLRPAVGVLDILMPGLSGLDVLARVREEGLSTRVILCTGFNRQDWVIQAVESGAAAYLFKGDLLNGHCGQLIAVAVDAALSGNVFMTPEPLKLLVDESVRLFAAERTGGLLNPREARIAKLIARGLSNKEMARDMSLSARTIENIRSGMMKKIGAGGIADVVRYVEARLKDRY